VKAVYSIIVIILMLAIICLGCFFMGEKYKENEYLRSTTKDNKKNDQDINEISKVNDFNSFPTNYCM
jgi:uncharacterized protein YxeA